MRTVYRRRVSLAGPAGPVAATAPRSGRDPPVPLRRYCVGRL